MTGVLVSVGNVVVDVIVELDALPSLGGDVVAKSGALRTGGTFNVMLAAARQGMNVIYGGVLGSGPLASLARSELDEAGITIASLPESSADTGFVVTVVDGAGERSFVTVPGAETRLRLDHLEALSPAAGDVVYCSGYGLAHDESRVALARWLPELADDVVVVFDPGPLGAALPSRDLAPVMARADWCTCNAREAEMLTGREEPDVAAQQLARTAGREGVLVRTGASGCVLAVGGHRPERVAGYAVRAVDTNGAGDAHSGAFLAALAGGREPHEAARWANAVAAIAVSRRGPATAPMAAEVTDWLSRR